jgi:hypothetical protein
VGIARTDAARVRGVLVGAISGAVAVAAHGLGGAMLPGGPAIVLLVLGSAAVGAASSSPAELQRRLPVVALYLSAGQVLGHYLLVLAASHPHGNHWSVPMVAAHALAALGAAALICSAERLFGAIAAVLWHLVVVLVALRGTGATRRPGILWWAPGLAARTLAGSGRATRGPPSFAAA